jgi:hypothetical protein
LSRQATLCSSHDAKPDLVKEVGGVCRLIPKIESSEMTTIQSKFVEGTVRETYSDAALRKAWSKYSFDFKLDGVACRAGYDLQESKLCIEGPEKGAELLDLAEKVEAIIPESKADLDPLEVRKFLCKHLRAMTKVEQELHRAPASERRFELLDSEPIDMNGMSLEDECVLEVLQEQSEKANQVGHRQRHAR